MLVWPYVIPIIAAMPPINQAFSVFNGIATSSINFQETKLPGHFASVPRTSWTGCWAATRTSTYTNSALSLLYFILLFGSWSKVSTCYQVFAHRSASLTPSFCCNYILAVNINQLHLSINIHRQTRFDTIKQTVHPAARDDFSISSALCKCTLPAWVLTLANETLKSTLSSTVPYSTTILEICLNRKLKSFSCATSYERCYVCESSFSICCPYNLVNFSKWVDSISLSSSVLFRSMVL